MSEEKKNIPPENDSAQKKPTLEEDIKIYEEAVSIDRSRQKSRRVFVFYIIGLFCVALVLILLSYVMQAHANQELEALGTQLTEQTDAAGHIQPAFIKAKRLDLVGVFLLNLASHLTESDILSHIGRQHHQIGTKLLRLPDTFVH